MKIPLDVSRHCVQTAAKSAYEALVKKALRAGPEELAGIETEVEALRLFLESADFPALRSAHPALSGGAPAQVYLKARENGACFLYLDGREVFGKAA